MSVYTRQIWAPGCGSTLRAELCREVPSKYSLCFKPANFGNISELQRRAFIATAILLGPELTDEAPRLTAAIAQVDLRSRVLGIVPEDHPQTLVFAHHWQLVPRAFAGMITVITIRNVRDLVEKLHEKESFGELGL
jgi:hypothetical protein